jgi:hypothetical protein
LLFFAFKRCSWTVLNLQKVLQLRRAAADELQSALSRSLAASFWLFNAAQSITKQHKASKNRRSKQKDKRSMQTVLTCLQTVWHVLTIWKAMPNRGWLGETPSSGRGMQEVRQIQFQGNFTSWKENLRRIDASNFLEMFKGWHRT